MSNFLSRKEASKILGVHKNTIYNLHKLNEIETIKIGARLYYNVNKYLKNKNVKMTGSVKICYCRVSSLKQKPDLERQVQMMQEKYPAYEIIKDVGSGLNFKRKGLQKIIDLAVKGEIEELVIAYKDRLARFGYDLIELLIEKYSNGKIKILNKSEEKTPHEEITKDILSIMNVYVAKINGLRKYKDKIKKTVNLK